MRAAPAKQRATATESGAGGGARVALAPGAVAGERVGTARSAIRRSIVLLAGGPVVILTAVCGVLLIVGVPVPTDAIIIGRWIPAAVSLAVIVRVLRKHGGGARVIVAEWGLHCGGRSWVRCAVTCMVGAAVVVVIAVVTALLGSTVGAMDMQPAEVVVPGLIMMVPLTLVLALSTLGEEVVWRSQLPRLLGGGFWSSAFLVAGAWTAFHLPLHATFVLQGTVPVVHAAAVTVGLLPMSLFLSALAARARSVWPAVFAHAVPFSAANLAMNSAAIAPAEMWTITGIAGALFLSAAMAVAPVISDVPAPGYEAE